METITQAAMKSIFNEHKLPLAPDRLDRLIDDATQRRRFFTVTFSVLKVEGSEITIKVKQHKPFHKNVMPVKKMVEITRNLFGEYLPEFTIHVRAIPYVPSPPDVVDSVWIQRHMDKTGTRLKDLVTLTGIEKSTLSEYINGKIPLSQPVRAMFYYLLTNPSGLRVVQKMGI